MTKNDPVKEGKTLRYLSDEWLDAANTAVANLTPTKGNVTVRFVVVGGPDGERAYTMRLGPGAVTIGPRAGPLPNEETKYEPAVTLQLHWSLATKIAKGTASAQRAVLDGQILIDGDVRVLLGEAEALGLVEDCLAPLRARTEF